MLHEINLLSIIHESVKRIEVRGLKEKNSLADMSKVFKRLIFLMRSSQLITPNDSTI